MRVALEPCPFSVPGPPCRKATLSGPEDRGAAPTIHFPNTAGPRARYNTPTSVLQFKLEVKCRFVTALRGRRYRGVTSVNSCVMLLVTLANAQTANCSD